MCRLDCMILFWFIQCLIHAIPSHARKLPPVPKPVNPLLSAGGEIDGISTALDGPEPAENTLARPSLSEAPSSLPSATVPPSSAGGAQSSALQSSILSIESAATTTAEGGSMSFLDNATQASTGGAAASLTSTESFDDGTTSNSAGVVTISAVSDGTVSTTTTTMTGSHNPSSSSSGSGSGSGTGPNSGSGARPGSGSDSESDSGSDSGSGMGTGSSSSSSQKTGGLSPAQITIAVILPILALIAILFVLWRYGPPLRGRFTKWRQRRLERRAYRRALDDPVLSFGATEKGLGLGNVEELMRPLSFGFLQPQQQEVKRKPLSWHDSRTGRGTLSEIGVAVPLGEHRRTDSGSSGESQDARGENARLHRS